MASSYEDHARRLQAEATKAHREWVKSLTPAQRRKLIELKVLEPADDSPEVDGQAPCEAGDIADSPRARVEWDPADDIDGHAAVIADHLGVDLPNARKILAWHDLMVEEAINNREGELLAIVVGGLIAAKNVKVSTAGLAFAAKLDGINGFGSQSEFAKAHGISRSAISKVTIAWQRDLGLIKSVHQKSDEACRTYSAVGSSNHWRGRKADAVALLRKLKTQHP